MNSESVVIGHENVRYKFRSQKDIGKILDRAFNTLGSDKKFITWMACTYADLNYPLNANNLEEMGVYQWLRTTTFLGISVNSFQYGYCQELHMRSVFEKLKSGLYIFPMGKKIKVIKRKMINLERHEQLQRANFLGARLNFKSKYLEFYKKMTSYPQFLKNYVNSKITLFLSRITYQRLIAWSMQGQEEKINSYFHYHQLSTGEKAKKNSSNFEEK